MKFLIILFILPVVSAFSAECVSYEFQGAVKTLPGKYILVTQAGTKSERRLEFDHADIPKLAPYAEKHAKGEIILTEENPVSGTKVLSLLSIDFDAPDPLQTVKGLAHPKKVPCPKP